MLSFGDINGYKMAHFWENKKASYCLVHRLVATTFLQNKSHLSLLVHNRVN